MAKTQAKPVQGETRAPALAAVPEKFKAFTTLKVPGGYAFLELTLDKELNVVDLKRSEPDMKAITTEKFKIAVGKYWSAQEA